MNEAEYVRLVAAEAALMAKVKALRSVAESVVKWYEDAGNEDPGRVEPGSVELWSKARAALKATE